MKYKPYIKTREYLATHKKLPIFLSHGGLHLVVLILLLVIIGFLGYKIIRMSVKNFAVIDTAIEFVDDMDKNDYPLRHFVMSIKADSIKDKNHVYIKADFRDSNHSFKEYCDLSDKSIYWIWSNQYPNTPFVIYRYKGTSVTKGFEGDIITDNIDNGFKVTFKKYILFEGGNLTTGGNMLGENNDNPYYSALIRFSQTNVNLDSLSSITIDLSKAKSINTVIVFDKIYPEPSKIELNKFVYEGKDKVEQILKNGEIFFEAKDAVKAYRADKYYLLFSVLIGTLIAFCFDIIIKLIYKWRAIKLVTRNEDNKIEQPNETTPDK